MSAWPLLVGFLSLAVATLALTAFGFRLHASGLMTEGGRQLPSAGGAAPEPRPGRVKEARPMSPGASADPPHPREDGPGRPDDLEALLVASTGRMTRFLAHEANDALTSLLGETHAGLASGCAGDATRALASCQDAGRVLKEMFEAIWKVAHGSGLDDEEEADLSTLLDPALVLFARPLERAGVVLTVRRGEGGARVHGRRTLRAAVASMFLDLLERFTARGGGELLVAIGERTHQMEIVVRARYADVAREDGDSARACREGHSPGLSLADAVARLRGGGLRVTEDDETIETVLQIPLSAARVDARRVTGGPCEERKVALV